MHGVEGVNSGTNWYHETRNASENHISPEPVNFLTKVEIWDTLLEGHEETILTSGGLPWADCAVAGSPVYSVAESDL